jgi:hypothetical protein
MLQGCGGFNQKPLFLIAAIVQDLLEFHLIHEPRMSEILPKKHIRCDAEEVRQIDKRLKARVLDAAFEIADVGRGFVDLLCNVVLRQIPLPSVVPDALANDVLIE